MAKKNKTKNLNKNSDVTESVRVAMPYQADSETKDEGFKISYPLLWLAFVVIAIYAPTFKFGVTELDDTIFIRDFQNYNEHLSNLLTSFNRGLFNAVKDPYYRPIFLDSMVLNYWLSGHGQSIFSYHFINVLFHLCTVLLLYKFFLKLEIDSVQSFILTLIFAVHPVLTQAVSWIPGRNDTMLAIFILIFLIKTIDYTKSGKITDILFATFFLLISFFTKETAVFAAPAAFVLLVVVLRNKVFNQRNIIQYIAWAGCFVLWYYVRSLAIVQAQSISGNLVSDFFHRIPLITQYVGKIVLPINLSVFPMQEDTSNIIGIVSLLFLIATVVFSKEKNYRYIMGGAIIFMLFLLPALIVPTSLNEQTFEHRLYLPMIGALIILPQTYLFTTAKTSGQFLIFSFIVTVLLAFTNYNHQRNFADPYTFWTQAVETSPHSAFANMHLAEYEDNLDRKCSLIRKAYQLNPKEKYINFFYAEMLVNTNKKDSILSAEPYLQAEKEISGFYKCDFYLARIAVEKSDYNQAADHLYDFLKVEPETSKEGREANNNLLVIFMSTHQTNRLVQQAKHMKEIGMPIAPDIVKQYNL